MVKGTKEDASSLEQNGKHLADRWGLPYREAHTLSIDPAALEIVDREESRRLRVLPLEVGTDGPVFAVAEPSEERFTAVRDLAGDNATFVVVAKDTLDALLNSKVFSVSNGARKPSLFRRSDEEDFGAEVENGQAPAEAVEHQHEEQPAAELNGNGNGHEAREVGHVNESTAQLEDLFSQIASGAGSLRAQVDQLTGSLEATQHELREANEQLAEATRVAESHNETVAGLQAEIERLREELERSTALNDSMTARLEEVARALLEPSSGDGA